MMKVETVEQLLLVFRMFREAHAKGRPLRKAYQDGVRQVADRYGVTYQTIGDGCRRRMKLNGIEELYDLLGKWIGGDPRPLANQMKLASAPSAHDLIDGHFGAASNASNFEARSPHRDDADAGLDHSATVQTNAADMMEDTNLGNRGIGQGTDSRLTIAEAKRRLALTFGIDPASVKITIEA